MNTLWHWIVAHPYEALLLIGAILSFINGTLPSSVASGPFGKVIHEILDRLSVLSRTDAPGTLKWPLIATSLLKSPSVATPGAPAQPATPVQPVAASTDASPTAPATQESK